MICLKPTYWIRKLKNKGAIVIFVWNFFLVSVFNYLSVFIVPYGLKITMIVLDMTIYSLCWVAG